MLDYLDIVKNERILIVIPFIVIGAIFGVLVNLSFNQQPAPQAVHAAATPTPTRTPTPTPSPKPTATPTPILAFSIKGIVYIDVNGHGKHNDLDSNYTVGATVSAALSSQPMGTDVSNAQGKFTIVGLLPNTYMVTLTVPDGYRVTTDNPQIEVISNSNITNVKFGIIPTLWNIPTSEKFIMCKDLRQFVNEHC